MARYIDPVCRQCRRMGEKLFLKGERCYTPRCAIERRRRPPGGHIPRRRRPSDWAIQLKEKQKARFTYGVLERQFRKYFEIARDRSGITGDNLLQVLESRLDNVVYRMGMSNTRDGARQLVSHKHITVNGRIVNIPSYTLRPGDKIAVREKSKSLESIQNSLKLSESEYSWIKCNSERLEGEFINLPERDQIPENIKEQLIVELYSK